MNRKVLVYILISLFCPFIEILGNIYNEDFKGRIAISSDGNEHDDDDWSATAFSLALLKAGGLSNKLSLYIYCDHIWGSNQTYPLKSGMSAYDHMKESALTGKALFGFNNTKFICAVDNAEVAYEAMKNEINISSETNPLTIIAAGPMQVIGEAISRSNKECLKHVTIISHSHWNETHANKCHAKREKNKQWWDVHDGWTLDLIKNNFSKYGLTIKRIKDQNGKDEDTGLYCKIKQFDWLKSSKAKDNSFYKKGSWEWLYSRLEVCIKGKNKDCFDISDAGMIMYLLTGKEDNSANDVRLILENPEMPSKWE